MEYLVIRDRYGRTLFLWMTDHSDTVLTNDRTLFDQFIGGVPVRNEQGQIFSLAEGENFLDAAHLHFLIQGYEVQRTYVGRCGLEDPYCLESIVSLPPAPVFQIQGDHL
jgi:hypothetical protein